MSALWRELERNRRLRLGLVVAVSLLWCFALLELDDRNSEARVAVQQLQGRIARANALAGQEHWQEYREITNRTLAQFRARAWREESEGRIQAHLQDWLRGELTQSGIQVKELTVSLPQRKEPALENESGVAVDEDSSPLEGDLPKEMRVVHARLVFDFLEGPFCELIATLSTSDHWLWLERVTVRNWGTKSVELELGALFVIGSQKEGA